MTSLKSSYTQRLDDMVGWLKKNHNITMHWSSDVVSDIITVNVSKQNCQGRAYQIQNVISRYNIEDDMHVEIIRHMIHKLEKSVKDSDDKVLTHFPVTVGGGGGGGGARSWVIEPEKCKDFSNDDLNKIYKMKEAAAYVETTAIESILNHRYDRYSTSPFMNYNIVISGGLFTSIYHNEEVKDYDVFILEDYPVKQLFHENIRLLKNDDPHRFVQSDLDYLNNGKIKNITQIELDTKTKIQYIFTKYKTRQEVLDTFDVEHACVSYLNGNLYMSPLTFDCIKRKVLKPHKGNNIAHWRIDKFTKKGFKFEIDLV